MWWINMRASVANPIALPQARQIHVTRRNPDVHWQWTLQNLVTQKRTVVLLRIFPMTLTRFFAAALTTALLVTPLAQAATQEIHGVKVEDSAMVGGNKLQLNGAGTRYKGP